MQLAYLEQVAIPISLRGPSYDRITHAVLACAVSRWRSGRPRPRVLLASRPPGGGRAVCNEGEIVDYIRRGCHLPSTTCCLAFRRGCVECMRNMAEDINTSPNTFAPRS